MVLKELSEALAVRASELLQIGSLFPELKTMAMQQSREALRLSQAYKPIQSRMSSPQELYDNLKSFNNIESGNSFKELVKSIAHDQSRDKKSRDSAYVYDLLEVDYNPDLNLYEVVRFIPDYFHSHTRFESLTDDDDDNGTETE